MCPSIGWWFQLAADFRFCHLLSVVVCPVIGVGATGGFLVCFLSLFFMGDSFFFGVRGEASVSFSSFLLYYTQPHDVCACDKRTGISDTQLFSLL